MPLYPARTRTTPGRVPEDYRRESNGSTLVENWSGRTRWDSSHRRCRPSIGRPGLARRAWSGSRSGPVLGRERVRHAAGRARRVRGEVPRLRRRRHRCRERDHAGPRRHHRGRVLVDRTHLLPEGRHLHAALRGAGARVRLGPLTLRINPPIGGVLYWLRPGTVRLPPWPGRVPLTGGRPAASWTSCSTPACSRPVSGPARRRRSSAGESSSPRGSSRCSCCCADRPAGQDNLPGRPLGALP